MHQTIRIGITGHRNLTGEQSAALKPVIKRAIENIKYYEQNSSDRQLPVSFSSAIAKGADTLFARVALEYFDGDLLIILPFEKEEYLKDFDTGEEKESFERLLSDPRVKQVNYLNALGAGNRDDLYLHAGKKIVDDNEYIIAVWDERKAKGVGGTGDIVEYAIAKNKNLLVINPNEETLSINGTYLPHFGDQINNQPRPNVFSKDIVEDYFSLFDRVAIHNQVAYKRIWQLCFLIGWLGAALILAVKVAFNLSEPVQFVLTIFEIACLATVLQLILKERRKSYHKNYLQYRFIAERLRMINLLYTCGFYPIKTKTKVIHKAMQEIESKYPVGMISKVIQLTSYSDDPLQQKKQLVKAFSDSQASYHQKRKKILEAENKTNHHIKLVCLAVFVAVILFHFVTEIPAHGFNLNDIFIRPVKEPDLRFEISYLLYLFVPATLARFEAVKYLNDWERLITQSAYMNEFFTEVSGKTEQVTDEEALYGLLVDLNDNIYLENLDWEMFMTNKNEEIT